MLLDSLESTKKASVCHLTCLFRHFKLFVNELFDRLNSLYKTNIDLVYVLLSQESLLLCLYLCETLVQILYLLVKHVLSQAHSLAEIFSKCGHLLLYQGFYIALASISTFLSDKFINFAVCVPNLQLRQAYFRLGHSQVILF